MDSPASAARRKLQKLHVYAIGGDYADNGVDQLIIDGEAMPVLKVLIREGKTPGVREGAVRLLTRLCTTPEARQEVRSASSLYNVFSDCLASVAPTCCITVLLLLLLALIVSLSLLICVSRHPPGCRPIQQLCIHTRCCQEDRNSHAQAPACRRQ